MAETPDFLNWKPVDLGEPRSSLEPQREDETTAEFLTAPRTDTVETVERIYSRVPLSATEEELAKQREVGGIPEGEGAEYAPQRLMQTTQEVQLPQNPADYTKNSGELYQRFFRYDNEGQETNSRSGIERSVGFYIPRQVYTEDASGVKKRQYRLDPDMPITEDNFQFIYFPQGLSVEDKSAYMARMGAYKYAIPQGELDDPFATNESGQLSQVWDIEPRYMTDLRDQRTAAKGTGLLPTYMSQNLEVGQGKEKLSKILTEMGYENPVAQVAILAAEDVGEFGKARGFPEGARTMATFIGDIVNFLQTSTAEGMTAIGAFNMPGGGYDVDAAQTQLNLIEQQAQASALTQLDAEKKGMTYVDEATGLTVFKPEYKWDYIGALEAEGIPRQAAEKFWKYETSIAGHAGQLLGEEAIPIVAAAGIRLLFAAGTALQFNRYVKKTLDVKSIDEAIKKGYTPQALINGYLTSRGDGWLAGFSQRTIVNSARILSNFRPGFAGVDAAARSNAVDRLNNAWSQVIGKRNALSVAKVRGDKKEIKRLQAELDEATGQYRGAQNYVNTLNESLLKGSWMAETARQSGYGIGGAVLLSATVEEYFGEDYAPFAEIAGFIAGPTMTSVVGSGSNSLIKFLAMNADDAIELLGANIGLSRRIFEGAGIYGDFDKLPGKQKEIVSVIAGLSPVELQGLRANASFINGIQDSLLSIKDSRGQSIFTEDFLDSTLGVITGLNMLRLAEQQLTRSIAISDVGKFGPEFYTQEVLLGKQTELVQRLGIALNTLVPAIKDKPELEEFVSGLRKYHSDLSEELAVSSKLLSDTLAERQNLVRSAVLGDQDSWDMLGITSYEELPERLMDIISQDEDLFVRAQKYMGKGNDEIMAALETRVRERDQFIRTTAETMANSIGGGRSMFENGPQRLALLQLTSRASSQKTIATLAYDEIDPDVYMDFTQVYDYLLRSTEDVAEGAKREGGDALKGSTLRNHRDLFQAGAQRALTMGPDALTDPQVAEISKLVGAAEGDYLDLWEKLRSVGLGTSGFSDKKIASIQELLPDGVDIEAFSVLDLPVNITEFKEITSGIGLQVRNVFAKTVTGQGSREPRALWEELHEAAVDPELGFRKGYFSEDGGVFAREEYDKLIKANQIFRTEYAERYLRGNRLPKILKGRDPTRTATVGKVEWSGTQEASRTLDILLGPLANAQGALTRDTLRDTYDTLAGALGTRVPDGGITVRTLDGKVKQEAGGRFVLIDGEDDVEGLRDILTAKLVEDIWTSPGAQSLRDLARDGHFGEAGKKLREELLKGKGGMLSFDWDQVRNYMQLTVLRKNADGTFTETTLLDEDKLLESISFDAVAQVDKRVKIAAYKVSEDLQKTLTAMKEIHMNDRRQLESAYKSYAKAIESLGESPQEFFTNHFNRGSEGMDDVFKIREMIEKQRYSDALAEGRQAGLSGNDLTDFIDDEVVKAVDEFDRLRADHFGRWVKSEVVGLTEDFKPVYDVVTGTHSVMPVTGFKSGRLLEMLGADGGPNAQRNRDMFFEVFQDEDAEKKYDQLVSLGRWGVVQTRKNPQGVVIDGIAQGLSVESWISRVYSINRGVVSPRYVAAEAMIQAFRKNGVSFVEAMVNDTDFAQTVMKILDSDAPLPTEKENLQFVQQGLVALSMILVRYGYTEEEVEKTMQSISTDLERQMDQIQPDQEFPIPTTS